MARTLLFTDVTEKYKETSLALKEVKFETRQVIRKTLVEMMRQSFFHGASRYGTNFIAQRLGIEAAGNAKMQPVGN